MAGLLTHIIPKEPAFGKPQSGNGVVEKRVHMALSLLLATVFGLPVSTTNTKTAAIVGAGCSKNPHMVNWGVAREMVLTWVLTFPGCGLIGYALARVFLRLF